MRIGKTNKKIKIKKEETGKNYEIEELLFEEDQCLSGEHKIAVVLKSNDEKNRERFIIKNEA